MDVAVLTYGTSRSSQSSESTLFGENDDGLFPESSVKPPKPDNHKRRGRVLENVISCTDCLPHCIEPSSHAASHPILPSRSSHSTHTVRIVLEDFWVPPQSHRKFDICSITPSFFTQSRCALIYKHSSVNIVI